MTKSIAIIRLQHALALQQIISSEETRYYLCGALVEPHQDRPGAVMTATDGHLLVSVFDPDAYCAGEPQIWRIREYARDLKTKATNLKKGYHTKDTPAWVRFEEFGKADFRVAIAIATTAEEAAQMEWDSPLCCPIGRDAAIDGSFPNYRVVFPVLGQQREGDAFDAAQLGRLAKFAEEMAGGRKSVAVRLEISDKGAPAHFAVEVDGIDAMGLIMPMRNCSRLYHMPAWLVAHTGRPELGVEAYNLAAERAKREAGQAANVA